MLTLRCTHRVREKLGLVPSNADLEPTTRLGDWYADWVPRRRPLVLLMSERTRLAVVVPAAPRATFVERWVVATGRLLERLEVPATAIETELLDMREPAIGATPSRPMLECLAEATRILRALGTRADADALLDAEERLADATYPAVGYECPRARVPEAFGSRRIVERHAVN